MWLPDRAWAPRPEHWADGSFLVHDDAGRALLGAPRRSMLDRGGLAYTEDVKQIWSGRVAQAAGKYGEHAPMATVCCNACRTCATANILSAVAAASLVSLTAARRILLRRG